MKTRKCHICGNEVGLKEYCPKCTSDFANRRDVETMTVEERINELELLFGPLEIDFDLVHLRIEELVGRPVFTRELGNGSLLIEEVKSGNLATFQEVFDKIPSSKELVLCVKEEDHEM